MMFLAGLIGGKVRKSAMETVKMSFGQKGGLLFCRSECAAAGGMDRNHDL